MTHGPGALTSDYDYTLPPDRIARVPVEPRDASRLLVVDRATGTLTHRTFRDLPVLIPPGDVLVLNTTRVTRARLLGKRTGSGAPAEISGYLGKSDAFDEAIGTFSVAYADQNERDHDVLKKAVQSGRVEIITEDQ